MSWPSGMRFHGAAVHVLVVSHERAASAHQIGNEHDQLLLKCFAVAQSVAMRMRSPADTGSPRASVGRVANRPSALPRPGRQAARALDST